MMEELHKFDVTQGSSYGTAIHALAFVGRHAEDPEMGLLLLDLSNAFNCVDRKCFLEQCRQHFPSLAPWAEWCYAEPSRLRFGELPPLSSESGVQQGDPLGPLLFALAIQPILRQLKETHGNSGLDIVFGYLDDCVLLCY